MIARQFFLPRTLLFILAALLAATTLRVASPSAAAEHRPAKQYQGLPGLEQPGFQASPATDRVEISANFTPGRRPGEGLLHVTATMREDRYTYSISQPKGGPNPTVIHLDESSDFQLTGDFQPDEPPHIEPTDVFPGIDHMEEHFGEVTWTAPFQVAQGVDLESLAIGGEIEIQVCDEGSCTTHTLPFVARYTAPPATPVALAEGDRGEGYRVPDDVATIYAYAEPATAVPGDVVDITIVFELDDDYHVYKSKEVVTIDDIAQPTLIVISDSTGHYAGVAHTSAEEHETEPIGNFPPDVYYEGEVVWQTQIVVPPDFEGDTYELTGILGYQNCTDNSCNPPRAVPITLSLPVGDTATGGSAPFEFGASTSYTDAGDAADQRKEANWPMLELPEGDDRSSSALVPWWSLDMATLLPQLGFALLGGMILNLMPCVLPVIGLKIFAFAKQGGESRGRVFALNFTYALGMLAVFMILASLAAFLSYGWGQLFTLTWFKVSMTALVFVMALAFLNVWELPVPSFLGGGKAGEMQQKEGYEGAFIKGMFTTLLATPCSGPFLGPVFAYTLTQSTLSIYLIFACIGLGMASPYILIGIFPALIRFLPKPGAWMDTFKQLLAFVLLGTVVYLLSTLDMSYFIPTMVLLVGLWFGCWLIGRTPITAETSHKVAAWGGGIAIAAALGWVGFTQLGPSPYELPWQPFSPYALQVDETKDKTILVDFTANWCLTCQLNSKRAINTEDVQSLVKANGVVPLLADWTDKSPEIERVLGQFESKSIPLLVILPANQHDQPIILRDVLSEDDVLAALEEAGPSIMPEPSSEETASTSESTAMLAGERTE